MALSINNFKKSVVPEEISRFGGIERVKGNNEDIINTPLTLRDFAMCELVDDKTGEVKSVAACVFDEDKEAFYFAPSVLSDICATIESNGQHKEMNEDGLSLALVRKKSKKGNTYFDVVDPADLKSAKAKK